MRLAALGEGLVNGQGAVMGGTFFEDDPIEDGVIGWTGVEQPVFVAVENGQEQPRILSAGQDAAKLIGAR